jgi:uncharacterized membrane protein
VNILLILLRIVHIGAGVFWVGAALVSVAFIAPAARASGPEGQKFVRSLMVDYRLTQAMYVASWLTIGAGVLLYLRDSGGLQMSWITSAVGLGYTIGAIAALASLLLGLTVLAPTARRMGALGAAMEAADGPSPAERQAEMGKLGARMGAATRINVALLSIALLCMATARYWLF